MPSLFNQELMNEFISTIDKKMFVQVLLSDEIFRKELIRELTASGTIVAELPISIDCNQARLLLGGISDSTLSRMRKRYPEMIVGGPRSKRYNRDVILRLAKNRGNAKF